MPLNLVKSQKGKNMLSLDGHLYVVHRTYSDHVIRRCCEYFTRHCLSRIQTSDIKTGKYHNLIVIYSAVNIKEIHYMHDFLHFLCRRNIETI